MTGVYPLPVAPIIKRSKAKTRTSYATGGVSPSPLPQP